MRDLAEPARTVVQALVARARSARVPAYLVGGPVRDLMLGRPSLDIDIVVEGDAPALARALETHPNVMRVVTHAAFGTATLRLTGAHVDVTSARSETYPRPGALPRVTPGTIADDLGRRDFTINAMALRLTEPGRGELLDPHGGRNDLETGVIRALHERSFEDDATRILRAARYETRLGFRLESQTEAWVRRDAHFLQAISPARLHRELALTFGEEAPGAALSRLDELGALQAIDPALRFEPSTRGAFLAAREPGLPLTQAALWVMLLWAVAPHDAERLARRLALTTAQHIAVEAVPAAKHAATRLAGALPISGVVHVLAPLPEATLVGLAATSSGVVRDRVVAFLTTLRHVRPILHGDDVISLGVPRGPAVSEVLDLVRIAILDGAARTREDEEQIVRDYVTRTL